MLRSPATIKVFIADDSALIRERVAAMLEASAMSIVGQATTPQEAIDSILACSPDVVVLDVQLERGQGLEVLCAVRPIAPDIGFVVFSNNAGAAYRKRYLAEGANVFLDKTADLGQLVQAVKNASHHVTH